MTEARWLDEREDRAWRAIHFFLGPLTAEVNRRLSVDSGLSGSDYAVLVALSEAPEDRLRARDLVLAVGWEKSRLSHQIRRMEARGLVDRQGCPSDGRGAFVRLTPAGRVAIEHAAPGHVAAVRALFLDALTTEQLESFSEVAEKVGGRVRTECEAHGGPDL